MELNKTYEIGPSTKIMELMKLLLQEKVVDSVVWFEAPKSRLKLRPAEITNPDDIKEDLLGQYCLYNYDRLDTTANYIRKSLNGAKDKKVAVIAKPCDVRAFVELEKLRQVKMENILILAIECPETLDSKSLSKELEKAEIDPESILTGYRTDLDTIIFGLESGKKEYKITDELIYVNCTRCPRKISTNSDINIGYRGFDEWTIRVVSDKGKEAVDKIAADKLIGKPVETENEFINKLIEISQENRAKDFKELDEMTTADRFKHTYGMLSKCRKCGACINACPVCFCQDCDLLRKIKIERKEKKAGVPNWEKMDNVLYLLTKMGHMCDTCIECGKCSQVCPVNIPSANIYRYIIDKIEKKYNYIAGKDVSEMPPRSGKEVKELLSIIGK